MVFMTFLCCEFNIKTSKFLLPKFLQMVQAANQGSTNIRLPPASEEALYHDCHFVCLFNLITGSSLFLGEIWHQAVWEFITRLQVSKLWFKSCDIFFLSDSMLLVSSWKEPLRWILPHSISSTSDTCWNSSSWFWFSTNFVFCCWTCIYKSFFWTWIFF